MVSLRWSGYTDGLSSPIDIIIFLIWVSLLFSPLFREVNFFGVGLKNEIDRIRNDLKEQIINLRSDVQNTISVRTEVSYNMPPADHELKPIKEHALPVLEQDLKKRGIQKSAYIEKETRIPDDINFLFLVRYEIEKELRRIWHSLAVQTFVWSGNEMKYLPRTFIQIADGLAELTLISPEVRSLIRNVYAICSSAIHGEPVSEKGVDFVREVSSYLILSLKTIMKTKGNAKEE